MAAMTRRPLKPLLHDALAALLIMIGLLLIGFGLFGERAFPFTG